MARMTPPEAGPAPPPTPLQAAVARVGDRWTMLIVEALLGGPRRFNDLAEAVPGIAPNILSQRLKALERDFLVSSEPYSEHPPRFAYRLTDEGADLGGALRLLGDWAARHGGAGGDAPRHEACGTPVEARWYCPTCDLVVDEAEAEIQYI
jgi:DNA-binding HxlR family transcriptional regulator